MNKEQLYQLFSEAHETTLRIGQCILIKIEMQECPGRLNRLYRQAVKRERRRHFAYADAILAPLDVQ